MTAKKSPSEYSSRHDIYRDLRNRIESGTEWGHGDRFPSIDELASEYEAASGTVRAAVTQLAIIGLISAGRGRAGTKVIAGPRTRSHLGTFPPADWTHPEDKWGADEGEVSAETSFRQKDIAGTEYIERDYLRKVGGIPVQHKRTTIPMRFASVIPEGCTTPPFLMPDGVKVPEPPAGTSPNRWYGWKIRDLFTEITLEAAPDDVATKLGLPEGTPVLQQVTRALQKDGTTVYVTTVTTPAHSRVTLHQIDPEGE